MRPVMPAPSFEESIQRAEISGEILPAIIAAGTTATERGEYPHWEDVRRRPPPAGLSRIQAWFGIKFARASALQPLPLIATSGRPFRYSLPDPVFELLHWIDQHAAGEIAVSEAIPDVGERRRYLVSSLIEESITSSQLEGAATTRRDAKEMLRTGRRPRDRDEQMIVNNYRAMSQLRSLQGQPLTIEVIHELHRTLTEATLDDPSAAGRPQRPGEERVRVFDHEGNVVHIPPPAEELETRMEAMRDFANGAVPGRFVHPVVRAILLHLWLAYDHPYEDGNGRTARALFYWEMLAQGYWLFEYVSISRLLLKAPVQYARAFQYTETDEYDATYFIVHQLQTIKRAIEEMRAFIERKMLETRETVRMLRLTDLNNRQVALLTHALRHPDAMYSVTSHSGSHRIARQSARTDLLELQERGLLRSRRPGKAVQFFGVEDLRDRIGALSG